MLNPVFMRPELLFQIAAEAVAFAVNGGDDFRRVRRRFEVFANPTDSDVHGTVMRLQLAAGHFLQQFATGLDLAGFSQKCSMARNSLRGSLYCSPAGLISERLLMSSSQPLNL